MPSHPTNRTDRAVSPPSRTVLELAEEAEDRFDEACEHARRSPGHTGLTVGPSLSVPMARLRAGRLAWSREVVGAGGRAELFYVLDPTPSTAGAAELPLLDLELAHVVADFRAEPSSPIRLLGVGDPKSTPKEFGSFVRAVRRELSSDSE